MSGPTLHAANHDPAWRAVSCEPDLCRVGNSVCGFDSHALLDDPVLASPNVSGDGKRLYREGDLFKGVLADAGSHIVAGTSQGSSHVKLTEGQGNVKVNGKALARDGHACMVNCNASGVGGAKGNLVTEVKPPAKPLGERMADESGKVLKDRWKGVQDSAKTVWQALPFTSDEAVTQAARGRIMDGLASTAQGLGALMGPPREMFMSGNAQVTDLALQMQATQQQAVGAVVDGIGKSWREASARSGTAGAVAMVMTAVLVDAAGTKGLGALATTGARIAEIGRLAKTPVAAAKLLDEEIRAAKAAGKSAQDIALLEKAKTEQMALARAQADAAKADAGAGKAGAGRERPGVHVRMSRTKVPCFHPYDKPKFAAMNQAEQKAYLKEMADQLSRQEQAINSFTAAEYKAARDAFENAGVRNPLAKGLQKSFRDDFEADIQSSLLNSLPASVGATEGKAIAAAKARDIVSKLSALHEPDMVAGGWLKPAPTSMGRADVNSSIGGSWNQGDRISTVNGAAKNSIDAGHGHEMMNVQLEVCRSRR